MNMNVESFAEEIRDRLMRRADEDSYESYVNGHTRPAYRLGYALVELGEVDEAKHWFRALASTYCDGAEYTLQSKFAEERSHSGALPENALQRALQTAIMTGETHVVSETGQRVYELLVDPPIRNLGTLDELDGREERGRVDTIVTLAAFLTGRDTEDHITAVRDHARAQSAKETPLFWEGTPFNRPHADLIEGLATNNRQLVEDGINGLVWSHEEHRLGNGDIHDIEQQIDCVTTTAIVLARSYGHDIRPDSEYIPSAAYSSEHYPLN
jgi:hypothetical protein